MLKGELIQDGYEHPNCDYQVKVGSTCVDITDAVRALIERETAKARAASEQALAELRATYDRSHCRRRRHGYPVGRHGFDVLDLVPRDKTGLVEFFRANNIEGVVWWKQEGDDSCDKIKITAAALGVERMAR